MKIKRLLVNYQQHPQQQGHHLSEIQYTKQMYEQPLNKYKIDRWKKEMTLFSRVAPSVLMGIDMHNLGYEVDSTSLAASKLVFQLFKNNRIRTATKNYL